MYLLIDLSITCLFLFSIMQYLLLFRIYFNKMYNNIYTDNRYKEKQNIEHPITKLTRMLQVAYPSKTRFAAGHCLATFPFYQTVGPASENV